MESYPVLVAPELIEILLHTVHACGISTLASCLRVCKKWRAIGEPILWRHIYLELNNFDTFISGVSKADLRRIHSMTLRFDMVGISKDYKIKAVVDAAQLLMPSLSKWPNLVSLSCRFAPAPGFRLAEAILLFEIPATIRNLELLSCRPEWIGTVRSGGYHLCNWIAIKLPQLQRLRLSCTRVCSRMFTRIRKNCPLLDEIIIDGRVGLVSNCVTDLPDYQSVLHSCIRRPFLDAFCNSQVRHSLLSRRARVLFVGQRFVSQNESQGTFGYLYTINCIDNITTVYPCAVFCGTRVLGGTGDLEVEEGSQSEEDTQVDEGVWMRYSIPNGREVDMIDARNMSVSPKDQLEMLGGSSWLQLGHGARLPHALRREQEYDPRYTTSWRTLIDNAVRACKRYWPGAALWYWEDRVGRKLLHVQTHKGHELPDYPRRERPQEEQDMDPCSITILQLEGLPSNF